MGHVGVITSLSVAMVGCVIVGSGGNRITRHPREGGRNGKAQDAN